MAIIKIQSKTKLFGKTIFSTSDGGGGFVSPVDTTIYNPDGTIYDTEGNPLNGNVPDDWKRDQGIAGYVDIGTSATSIGSYAFHYNQLTSVTIPNSVTSIGSRAFSNNQLTSVTIPDSVTSIGGNAFYGNGLTSVTIGNSVTSIGSYAFGGYNPLESVILANGRVDVPESFARNAKLGGALTIPDSVTSIGSYAFQGNRFTSVTIPDFVTSIGSYAFQGQQLTSVTIGNSVNSIGNGAFQNNQFGSITIPDSVTSIGSYAFSYSNIGSVNCNTTLAAFVGSNIFSSTADPLTIHARATDGTWIPGTGLSFQGNENVTVIKDL
jgi:hypothetical protein